MLLPIYWRKRQTGYFRARPDDRAWFRTYDEGRIRHVGKYHRFPLPDRGHPTHDPTIRTLQRKDPRHKRRILRELTPWKNPARLRHSDCREKR